ncbi:MAG: TerC family protein [Flavobacteriaceae bacterium]|jgi:predicted tellurium resistance membrane protein TerC
MFDIFASADAWIALLTLTFLEIVLGIDNIIFISIAAGKLSGKAKAKAINIGLLLAMVNRIILLFGISVLTSLKTAWFHIDWGWISGGVSGQAIILFLGGLFLLYKSTREIHEKIEDKGHQEAALEKKQSTSFSSVLWQIIVIDLVFSVDSILTAIGMTNGISPNPKDALMLMVIAVVVSVGIMMLFARAVGDFVGKHPTIQVLALSFLILIGFMLITEAAHLSHAVVFGQSIGAIPKGYLYFAIAFSLGVEFINMKLRPKK